MDQLEGLMPESLKQSKDIKEKIEAAIESKNKGNDFIRQKNYQKALYHYHVALLNVKGLNGLSDDQKKDSDNILSSCFSNMAFAQLSLGKFEKTVEYSTKCLEILNNQNKRDQSGSGNAGVNSLIVKALFRKGKAELALNSLDDADRDLSDALKLAPGDKAILREIHILKQKQKVSDKKAAKFYSRLFDKMKDEPDPDQHPTGPNQGEAEEGDRNTSTGAAEQHPDDPAEGIGCEQTDPMVE